MEAEVTGRWAYRAGLFLLLIGLFSGVFAWRP